MQAFRTVIINILVLGLLLALVEAGYRLTADSQANANTAQLQWQQFAPYMMYTNPHNPAGSFLWNDHYHNTNIRARIVNNRRGFPMAQEVDFATKRPKSANERVVIFTGGSAAWGVGASSNATATAGRLETILNEGQSNYRYTVLNLGMGGWVSFQQYIALSLFGRNLQPDWLVSMDATNDAAVACAHSQGAGRPMHYALMEAYMKAYTFGQLHPVFYRGWLENELIKHSEAYRRITGTAPVNINVLIDKADPGIGRSVIEATTWEDVKRQLELYILTEGQMVDLFPQAKVILSTQPLPFTFDEMFGRVYQTRGTTGEASARAELDEKLNKLDASSDGQSCGLNKWGDARGWFMPQSALRLEELVRERKATGRDIAYANLGALFPNDMKARIDFFIDPVHMNEAGMDIVAHFYAKLILATDFPELFEPPKWAGSPLPPPVAISPKQPAATR